MNAMLALVTLLRWILFIVEWPLRESVWLLQWVDCLLERWSQNHGGRS